MECGEVGVILTAVFIVLVLVIVTLVLVILVIFVVLVILVIFMVLVVFVVLVILVIVIAGILLILLMLAVFAGTIGGRKPNRIAPVVGDSSVFQDLAILAFVFVIVIPSGSDVDCS